MAGMGVWIFEQCESRKRVFNMQERGNTVNGWDQVNPIEQETQEEMTHG